MILGSFEDANVLPAIVSRVSRQRRVVTNMNIRNVVCRTKKKVDDLLILSNKAETGSELGAGP